MTEAEKFARENRGKRFVSVTGIHGTIVGWCFHNQVVLDRGDGNGHSVDDVDPSRVITWLYPTQHGRRYWSLSMHTGKIEDARAALTAPQPVPAPVSDLAPIMATLNRVASFLCGLQLTDHPRETQMELVAVCRELLAVVRNPKAVK